MTISFFISMRTFFENWKDQTKRLKVEVHALYLAYRDPRVPWHARIFAALVVGYAFSPIDLIPDFVPILGYLDDLILIPLGIKLALSLIPKEVMEESRVRAREIDLQNKSVNWIAASIIILIWIALAMLGIITILRYAIE